MQIRRFDDDVINLCVGRHTETGMSHTGTAQIKSNTKLRFMFALVRVSV